MYVTLALVGSLLGLAYLSSHRQPGMESSTLKDYRLNPSRKNSAYTPKGGVKNTENNFAFFEHPVDRHRANALSLYEAEALENKHELHDEIMAARRAGNNVRLVELLARWNRARETALNNVGVDYNHQHPMIQIRRNPDVKSSKRIFESVADHPKFKEIGQWQPHYRSTPLAHSMTKSYWRPNAYQVPGWVREIDFSK